MNIQRITRLLKLLQMLQSGSGRNADGLAADCEVSRRTVFRDLEALKAAGVPIAYDSGVDRYSVPSTYFLPPINFTAAEAMSLLALSSEMGRSDRLPFYEPAQAAALKLADSLPGTLRKELRTLTRAIRIRPTPVNRLAGKRNIYEQLVAARAARRVVRIEYDSLTEGEHIITKLRPYCLHFYQHSWYAIGRSSLHRGVRTFNLSRVASLKMLPERFSMPAHFSVERYLQNAWAMIPGEGPDQQVEVRFKPLVARNVAEIRWHKTQQHELESDGSLVFRARVSGLHEIVWWILGYGDQAEVLRPIKLRQLVAQRARNMAAMYDGRES
jgi:predicted DNA-binding transcriptional regulator YafY